MLVGLGEFIHVYWKSLAVGVGILITSKVRTNSGWSFGGEVIFDN